MTRVARTARALAAAFMLAGLAYVAVAFAGGSIPVNAGWRPPASGITIVVESNGIHTGFVLPKHAAGVDWRDLARSGDLADPRYAAHSHVAIGWGERAFFLDTPTWRDVRPAVLIGAALGSDRTLLHIEHVPPPVPGEDERLVTLRPEEYRRLAAFIRASLAPHPRAYRGYGPNDAFLDARGHYSAARTCNGWTGEALRHAGVRVGRWTPLPVTVMGWFR